MILKIKHTAVKVRAANSGQVAARDAKFTGAVTYSVVGTLDNQRVRHALGTEDSKIAARRVEKIQTACAVGPQSAIWSELEIALPRRTFDLFAKAAGYVSAQHSAPTVRPTWAALSDSFEIEMKRLVANKERGATREEGIMSESTSDRYRVSLKQFAAFLKESNIAYLDTINAPLIEMFKVVRHKQTTLLKQSRGGSGIALDISALHRIFAYAISKGMMSSNPINLARESKPGKNPKNPARPFSAAELTKVRESAGEDLFTVLVLRWTGLRVSDAISLKWEHVHFDRGANGEIEILTKKRSKIAIIPLAPELHDLLQEAYAQRKPHSVDLVLINPQTNKPFTSRSRLWRRMVSLGQRAGVRRVHPHCFRDTFICDMLARGTSTYIVGQMVADETDTIEKNYAKFVPAARDEAQYRMANGLGIEERAKLAAQRGRKVVGFPG